MKRSTVVLTFAFDRPYACRLRSARLPPAVAGTVSTGDSVVPLVTTTRGLGASPLTRAMRVLHRSQGRLSLLLAVRISVVSLPLPLTQNRCMLASICRVARASQVWNLRTTMSGSLVQSRALPSTTPIVHYLLSPIHRVITINRRTVVADGRSRQHMSFFQWT